MIDTNKAFELAESSGRQKALLVLHKIDLFHGDFNDYRVIPSEGKYCKWDFEVRDNVTNELLAVVEAKDRNMPSTDRRLIYGGAQLEAKKFDFLRDKANEEDILALYLCTYTDDMFYMWNITECEGITEDVRKCNKTTAVLTEKIDKHCYYFPMDNAEFKGKLFNI